MIFHCIIKIYSILKLVFLSLTYQSIFFIWRKSISSNLRVLYIEINFAMMNCLWNSIILESINRRYLLRCLRTMIFGRMTTLHHLADSYFDFPTKYNQPAQFVYDSNRPQCFPIDSFRIKRRILFLNFSVLEK